MTNEEIKALIDSARPFVEENDFLLAMVTKYDNGAAMTERMLSATKNTVEKKKQLKALSEGKNEHYGEVGYWDILELTLRSFNYSQGDYGTSIAYRFTDKEGRAFVEFTTIDKYKDISLGTTLYIWGKISGREWTRFGSETIKTTKITRCKVIDD